MADLISRIYGNFRGVDFRGEEINLVRSPDSVNMWKDYTKTDSIRTRPGMELVSGLNETVYGIYPYNDLLIVHAGTTLYKIENNEVGILYEDVEASKSDAFIYNNIWYFKDGKNYVFWDGAILDDVEYIAYVPTTSIGRKASGGGTTHEDVNFLSPYRYNTFLADGESTEYYLDAKNIDDDFFPEVTINDEVATGLSVDYAEGKITFFSPPEKPLTDGQDTVKVKFKKTVDGYKEKILNCTLLQVFDNRVFFSGNKDFPNVIYHCSLNDPTYCSDLDYYNEGLDSSQVKGLVAGNNALWVFKEPNQANTTIFYHNPTNDVDYGKIYPSVHSSVSIGCVGKAINFNDDIVFFSERGMEGINGDITTEQVVAHRSTLVDRKLISEANYENMILAEWEGYLVVCIDNKIYLADSRGKFTNEDHFEYEWFYWEMEKAITSARVEKGVLYLGTEDGLYSLTDANADVESYWVTPKDKFNYPQKQKTSNKRGCVAEVTGDVSVYAKTEQTDFELIGEYTNVTDYLVSRIKRKKFKDLQLKFATHTRFSLETVTMECFVGGYLKR